MTRPTPSRGGRPPTSRSAARATWASGWTSIAEQCGYAPQLQFNVPTRHYLLVEGLVHLELDGARRRETCPAPAARYAILSGLEVDAAVARRKVEAWRDWVAREPFEGRALKKEGSAAADGEARAGGTVGVVCQGLRRCRGHNGGAVSVNSWRGVPGFDEVASHNS